MAELIDKVELVKAVRESRKNNPHTDGSIARNHDMEHCHFLSLISRMPTTTKADIRNKAIDEFAERLKESLVKNYRHFITIDIDGFDWLTTDAVGTHIDKVTEQLKEE